MPLELWFAKAFIFLCHFSAKAVIRKCFIGVLRSVAILIGKQLCSNLILRLIVRL